MLFEEYYLIESVRVNLITRNSVHAAIGEYFDYFHIKVKIDFHKSYATLYKLYISINLVYCS